MSNPWIEHVRKFAKDNEVSYACAISMSECKESYIRPSKIQGETLSSAKTKYRGALKKWEIEFMPKLTTFQRQAENGDKQALAKLERTKEQGRKHLSKIKKLEEILKLFAEEEEKKKREAIPKQKQAKKQEPMKKSSNRTKLPN